MDEVIQIGDLECTVVCKSEKPVAASIFCHGFGAPGEDLVPCSAELVLTSGGKLDNVAFVFPAAPIDMAPIAPTSAL